jgi:hypothetical protein
MMQVQQQHRSAHWHTCHTAMLSSLHLCSAFSAASAAVQQRLSPAACEAFQQSVAAAVDNNLRLYRQRLQQAQQQLLQRELRGEQTLQSSSQDDSMQQQSTLDGAGQQPAGPMVSSVAQPASNAVSAAGQQHTDDAGGNTGAAADAVDAAVLTMQQLVALLAKRDAQPEQEGSTLDRWVGG